MFIVRSWSILNTLDAVLCWFNTIFWDYVSQKLKLFLKEQAFKTLQPQAIFVDSV